MKQICVKGRTLHNKDKAGRKRFKFFLSNPSDHQTRYIEFTRTQLIFCSLLSKLHNIVIFHFAYKLDSDSTDICLT